MSKKFSKKALAKYPEARQWGCMGGLFYWRATEYPETLLRG